MRYIFLDTETTGLSPSLGHRIVEIACVEAIDGKLTGRELRHLLNPDRRIPAAVSEIHGIDDAAVQGQPRFADIAEDLMAFIADGTLVIHNAPFDMAFIRVEFQSTGFGFQPIGVVDSLPYFRKRYPGMRCGLANLCEQNGIFLKQGEGWHGALSDARMLARLWQACHTDSLT